MMDKKWHVVHNLKAETYLELLLTSAAITVVMVRVLLSTLGFPQLGGSTIHIAHMMWGGMLMLGVILLFLLFIGRYIHEIAAIVGVIGFGIFIDELGKFVTRNNDYFFRPAMPLIYFVFVLLFLLGHYLLRTRKMTRDDYVVNALELFQESYLKSYHSQEFLDRLAYVVRKTGKEDVYTQLMNELLSHHQDKQLKIPWIHQFRSRIAAIYKNLLKKKLVTFPIIVFFAVYTITNAYSVISPLLGTVMGLSFFDFTLLEQLEVYSALVIFFITGLGLLELFFSRVKAYKTLQLSVYLSLFLIQFFVFYENQLHGLASFGVSLMTLFTLRYLIRLENHHAMKGELSKSKGN